MNTGKERTPASAQAHDPISVAALIAELPDLEKACEEARQKYTEALTKLNSVQSRITSAIEALQKKAPRESLWDHRSKLIQAVNTPPPGVAEIGLLQSTHKSVMEKYIQSTHKSVMEKYIQEAMANGTMPPGSVV